MNRREFLKTLGGCAACGAIAYLAGRPFFAAAAEPAAAKKPPRARAKSVIEIWVWGGPSQLETFDPKPDAPHDYNGGFKAIPTNVPGIEISEFFPLLAKHADKYSLIRSMTHPYPGHETATYLMQTGRSPGGGRVYPAIGAVIAMFKSKEYRGELPPYVILTVPKGRFSEVGFLNERYSPLVTGGNPAAAKFIVDGIVPHHIGHILGVHEGIVHRHDLHVVVGQGGTEDQAADAPETIDTDLGFHRKKTPFNVRARQRHAVAEQNVCANVFLLRTPVYYHRAGDFATVKSDNIFPAGLWIIPRENGIFHNFSGKQGEKGLDGGKKLSYTEIANCLRKLMILCARRAGL